MSWKLLLCFAMLQAPDPEDQLWQLRNRGKAFYENPTTQVQAVEEFRKALALKESVRERLNYGLALLRAGKTVEGVEELKRVQKQDPKLPHTWFNLGIHYKKTGESEAAVEQFEQMVKLEPGDAVSHYNLGVLYKLLNRLPDAAGKFQLAARLAPSLAAPHFQLYNAYRLAGKREEAMKELAVFQELKKAMEASGNSEDMEWNEYAEIYDPIDAVAPGSEAVAAKFTARVLAGTVDAATAGLVALNFNGDAQADLLVWSKDGGLLFAGARTPVAVAEFKAGRFFAAGDINNDALPEVCMLTASGAELFRNRAGKLVKDAKPLAEGVFVKALWIDYDHDYDLDLMLIGEKPVLLRNQGEAGFADRTADFPFAEGTPVDAVAVRTIADTKGVDVVMSYRGKSTVFYRDRLAGKWEAQPMPAVAPGATRLTAWDVNHDGYFDLAFQADGKLQMLRNEQGRQWKPMAAPAVAGGFAFADVTNAGVTEVIAGGGKVPGLREAAVMTSADFNNDGRVDLAAVDAKGIVVFDNATISRNRWFTVRLNGTKNLKLAAGSEVEIKAGRRYQKRLYEGFPLAFGLGGSTVIDAVRITWPNGMIQNETRQAVNRIALYNEAQRLSGSCPMIFTWNGSRFEFLTDVLGVAPLGATSGDGTYFAVDHDEYVSIPGEALREREGHYEIRLTEELAEVTYLDQLKLMAVDHPADVEIYSNDKWKAPPYPEFRLFAAKRRIYPIAARDGRGVDVRAKLMARDRAYADTFHRTMLNTAETHALELDFGDAPAEGTFLVLNGWVDWADGSTFRRQSQIPGRALTAPYLQVRDGKGEWRTVIEDMGIPSGKVKTIAVDLSGKFLSASRQVRIVTNMVVYWDEAFLGVSEDAPAPRLHTLKRAEAGLRFHGFSKPAIHPERRQPESFDYEITSGVSNWNPTPGMYTRYGDVNALLEEADDRMVIFGSGDEVWVRFAAQAPELPNGWKRDFLLLVDGWAKDADANTAYSQTVEPLPFHGMKSYPYGPSERFPGEALATRPALRLLRPLYSRGGK